MLASVALPKCWKDLIKLDFPLDLSGVTSEKHLTGIDDAKPHYDDSREVSAVYPNGYVATIGLYSGQSNYFGWLMLASPDGKIKFDAELDSYDDLDMELNNTTYKLNVKWY